MKIPLDPRDWYNCKRWRKLAKMHLAREPLCRLCLKRGIVTPACVVDHIERHAGNLNAFLTAPVQALCVRCHNTTKQRVELYGFDPSAIAPDGWPFDEEGRLRAHSGKIPPRPRRNRPPRLRKAKPQPKPSPMPWIA
jgi:predicted CXXCH cytochrome family protein